MKKSKKIKEKIIEWAGNNGCLLTIIVILIIVLVIAGLTNGLEGIGYVFAVIGALGLLGSISKGDLGCGFRAISLAIGVVVGSIGVGIITIGEDMSETTKAKDYYNSLNNQTTLLEYRILILNHYNRLDKTQQDDVLSRYYNLSIDSCLATIETYSTGDYYNSPSGLGFLNVFIENCPSSTYKEQAKARIKDFVDSLYYEAEKTNTYDAWEKYQKSVSSADFKDSEKRKNIVDTRWNSDTNAWSTAKSMNTISAYEKYLSLFPNGRHRHEADKLIIDMTVDATFAGEHGTLPDMDKVKYGIGSTSYVSVKNSTSYTLTLMYSGSESKRLVLSPHSSGSIRLNNGSYRIAASVSAKDVRNYAGTEILNGGSYEVEYYISTSSVPSYKYY